MAFTAHERRFPPKLARAVSISMGLVALVWFLCRVIPKPSRASYPCQRAAFPIATSFVLWALASSASLRSAQTARHFYRRSRFSAALLAGTVTMGLLSVSYLTFPVAKTAAQVRTAQLETSTQAVLTELPAAVSLVRSAFASAEDIDQNEINRMVIEAVQLAGGLDTIVSDGDTVVLKPNLVVAEDYSSRPGPLPVMVNGIATDYRVIQAVVDLVRALNPTGELYVMETSAVGSTLLNMSDLGWTSVSGVDAFVAIEHASGDWYEYDSPQLASVSLPEDLARFPDSAKPNRSREIYLNRLYFEADVLISLPLLKNHDTTGITGSVKNLSMGALPCNIYGNGPAAENPYHRGAFVDHGSDRVHEWIHDFFACRQPDFTVTDGLQGLQMGPIAWGVGSLEAAQMNMRLILAGDDALAVDAVSGLLMGQDPTQVNYLTYLHNDGFGCSDPALIEVVGERVEALRTDFANQNFGLLSKFSKFAADDYALDSVRYDAATQTIRLSVANDNDLARITFFLDGEPMNQYVVGDFADVSLSVADMPGRHSVLSVLFEDRYLNRIEKAYALSPTPQRSAGRIKPRVAPRTSSNSESMPSKISHE